MSYQKLVLLFLLAVSTALPAFAQHCGNCPNAAKAAVADSSKAKDPECSELPGYGKKCGIGQDFYFTYKFDKKPKMGTSIVKVMIFNKQNKQVRDWEIMGWLGMPAMPGSHDSEAAFKQAKNGEYRLPVNIVMPGEWEVRMTFLKDKKPVLKRCFKFKV
jgi:hypothetical protein